MPGVDPDEYITGKSNGTRWQGPLPGGMDRGSHTHLPEDDRVASSALVKKVSVQTHTTQEQRGCYTPALGQRRPGFNIMELAGVFSYLFGQD